MNAAVPSPQAMVWLRMRWVLLRHLGWQRALLAVAGPLGLLLLLQQALGFAWHFVLLWVAGAVGYALVVTPLRQLWSQNDPRSAHLVPGHLRALRQASWLLVGSVVAPLAALSARIWGPSATGLLLITTLVVTLAWLLRRPRLIWALTLVPPLLLTLLTLLVKAVPALKQPLAAAMALLGSPVGLLLAAAWCLWALWRWVGNGDAAHWRDHNARLQARRSAQRGWLPGAGWGDQLLVRLGRCFTWPREWHFERVLNASPVARIDHLLSRASHWSVRLWVGFLILLLLITLLGLGVSNETVERPLADNLVGLWIGVLSLAFAADLSRAKQLWRTRREQAVLALLPGISSQPGVLTRALALRWVSQGLIAWMLVLLPMMMTAPFTSPRIGSAMGLALAGCLPLMLAGCLIDPARIREPRGQTAGLQMGVLLVCAAAWLLSPLAWPFAWPVLAVCFATLPWALRRWRQLAQAPAPLPVGRLD